MKLVVQHGRGFWITREFAAGDSREVILFAANGGADVQRGILALGGNDNPVHRPRLVVTGQIVLFLMRWLHEDEQVVEPHQFTDALIEAATGQQPIMRVVD